MQMDSNALTREEFEGFPHEHVAKWLRANEVALKTNQNIIKIIEENWLKGKDLLELTLDEVKEMVDGRMGPRKQLLNLISTLNDMFKKAQHGDIKEPSSHSKVSIKQVPAHIAFIASSPTNEKDKNKLDQETEYDIMRDLIRESRLRFQLQFSISRWRASVENIQEAIYSGCFCIHHSGHGHRKKGLYIEGGEECSGPDTFLDGESLREMIQKITHPERRPKIVFLAACHSEVVGEKLVKDGLVNHVVVCRKEDELGDNGVPVFVRKFYQRLLAGETILKAFSQAKRQLREIIKWRVHRALSILEEHVSEGKFKEVSQKVNEGDVPFGEEIYSNIRALIPKENDSFAQEMKDDVNRLLDWAEYAEIEEPKCILLPRSNDDKSHDVKYEFKVSMRIEPKKGWIPTPESFFSRDPVDLPNSVDAGGVLSAVAKATLSDVPGEPLHTLKILPASKRILLICDNTPNLIGPSVFHEILKTRKSLLLLTTSRMRIADPDSLIVEMNPFFSKERFRKLFKEYLKSNIIGCENLRPCHFSKLYKDEKVGKDVRNPAMCMKMAKRMSRKDVPVASENQKIVFEDKFHSVRIAKTLIDEEKKAEKKRLLASMKFIPAPDQVPFFVGRKDVVKQVLHELQDTSKQVHLLHGSGGIGKSQLAVRLFNSLIETGQHSHAFWLNCQSTEKLTINYMRIAEKIPGLHVDKKNIKSAIQTIRERIETERCLLVLDDVNDCGAVTEFSPRNKGHAILTSRNCTDWSPDVKPWRIGGLAEEDLMQLAHEFGPSMPDPKGDDAKNCMECPKTEFSGHTVILAQFFSCCKQRGCEVADRIEELRKTKRNCDRKGEQIPLEKWLEKLNKSTSHSQSIVAVVDESLAAIERTDHTQNQDARASCVDGERALALLRSLACLDPKNIPLELVLRLNASHNQVGDCKEREKKSEQLLSSIEDEEVHRAEDGEKVRDALAHLERCSLTQWSKETKHMNMHAVTQRMVRCLRPKPDINKLVEALVRHGGDLDEAHNPQEECAAVLRHGTQLATDGFEAEQNQVPFFVGRKDVVKQVLHELQDTSKQVHLLHGSGGIGKSQLAVRLFNSLIETGQCSLAFWLNCQSTEKLTINCMRIAEKIPGLHVDKKNIKSAIQTIRERIETERCLLVLDDVNDCSAVTEFSPRNKGHVILTSRNCTDWSPNVKPWRIGGLAEEDLMQLTHEFGPSMPDPKGDDAKNCMEHPKTEFSGHTVILAQFFSCCKQRGCEVANRIEELRKTKRNHDRKGEQIPLEKWLEKLNKSTSHSQSIVAVVDESLAAIERTDHTQNQDARASCVDGERALALLRSLAHLDPKNIPLELVPRLNTSHNQVGDCKEREKKNEQLLSSIEELVPRFNSSHNQFGDCKEQKKKMEQLLSSIEDEEGHWAERLLSFIDDEEVHRAEDGEKVRDALAHLERHSSMQWSKETKHMNMHAVTQRAVRCLRPKPDINKLVEALVRCGGDLDEAHDRQEEWAAVLRHGTQLATDSFEAKHNWNLARAVGNACNVACLHDKASVWFKKGAKMMDAEVPAQPREKAKLADGYNNIGGVCSSMGKYPEALEECKKALDIELAVHGNDKPHPDVARSHNNIGTVHNGMGKYPEALEEFKKALDM
eukprot:jgi/Bigna1/142209/aug1.68_g16917